ncbi:MAG: hypothetical protein C5S44_00470, partial [Candidatus Methanocomedens sp.]
MYVENWIKGLSMVRGVIGSALWALLWRREELNGSGGYEIV